MVAAKRVLRHLKASPTRGLLYTPENKHQELTAYADSDYGGDTKTRKSTLGYLIYYCGGVVSYRSKLQPIVATSSAEAELIAVNFVCKEILYLRKLLKGLGVMNAQHKPTVIFQDNQAAIAMARLGHAKRTKHIDIQWQYLHERVKLGDIAVQYLDTKQMLADYLTKNLPKAQFNTLTKAFMHEI